MASSGKEWVTSLRSGSPVVAESMAFPHVHVYVQTGPDWDHRCSPVHPLLPSLQTPQTLGFCSGCPRLLPPATQALCFQKRHTKYRGHPGSDSHQHRGERWEEKEATMCKLQGLRAIAHTRCNIGISDFRRKISLCTNYFILLWNLPRLSPCHQNLWRKWEYKNEKIWPFSGGFSLEEEAYRLAHKVLSFCPCHSLQRLGLSHPLLLSFQRSQLPVYLVRSSPELGTGSEHSDLSQAHQRLQAPVCGCNCCFSREAIGEEKQYENREGEGLCTCNSSNHLGHWLVLPNVSCSSPGKSPHQMVSCMFRLCFLNLITSPPPLPEGY